MTILLSNGDKYFESTDEVMDADGSFRYPTIEDRRRIELKMEEIDKATKITQVPNNCGLDYICTGPPEGAKTEKLGLGLDQIPLISLEKIGKIFLEGEKKYGRNNWRRGASDEEYKRERWNHAERHLRLYNEGDRSEDHLAKVAWYAITTIWIDYEEGISLAKSTLEKMPF